MNAAVRAVTRMGIYVGAKVFLIYEVRPAGGAALEGGDTAPSRSGHWRLVDPRPRGRGGGRGGMTAMGREGAGPLRPGVAEGPLRPRPGP